MIRRKYFDILEKLKRCGALHGVKLAYAIIKNRNILENKIKYIQETIKPSIEMQRFETDRMKLCQEFAERDSNNRPVIKDNVFQITDYAVFEQRMNELREKNKEILLDRERQIREYEKFLDEEEEIDIHYVSVEDLPTDISVSDMDNLIDIIR